MVGGLEVPFSDVGGRVLARQFRAFHFKSIRSILVVNTASSTIMTLLTRLSKYGI